MGNLRAFPFFNHGSGSIWIRLPFSSLLFKRLNATATSATSAISTKPKPRHSPEARSVTARAPKAPPTREKCASRSRLVTELARLPTYTLGIPEVLLSLTLAIRSARWVTSDGLGQAGSDELTKPDYSSWRDKYIHNCIR